MGLGALDRRIRFDQKIVTQNSYGEEIVTWNPIATVWAERQALSGREFWAAQQINADITTRFRIRWREDLDPTMRLVDDSRSYDIHAILPSDDRRHWLFVMASARAE